MGNNSKAAAVVERKRKRKKKGRPSLLEIQKRSLRLQQQDQLKLKQNPNSTPPPNSSSHRHLPPSSSRRVTRRNPNPDPSSSDEVSGAGASSDEDDGGSSGKRREKKLKLVHRLPPNSGADLDIQDEEKKSVKGTDSQQEDALELESGSATPLPDKKTLECILDRLQKKDTYGVYSEPVDPEELPDYHDIIQHPMDFSTVRKKLSSGTYKSLEQFEKDVLLISSNAMEYNAPDTVYFRQARAIQELAKKSFENLRQGGDVTEQEPPKPAARRGRPPSKNKKPAVNTSSHDAAPDVTFDSAKPTNNSIIENNQQSLTYDIPKKILAPERPAIFSWIHEQRTDRNEELPSTGLKGLSAKYGNGKKPGVSEETWRKTYKLSLLSTTSNEIPILSTFDREKKILVPVGIQVEHAYARSVARFAAKLGPVGWAVAAKKIERVLPPGTKFGPGWVLDDEPTQEPKQHLSSPSHNTPTQVKAPLPAAIEKTTKEEDHLASQNTPPAVSRSGTYGTTSSSADNNTSTIIPIIESNFSEDNEPKGTCHSRINGFNTSMQNLAKAMVPHGQALSMIHRSGNINSGVINQRQMLNLANQDMVAPDLNVGFQQLSSPSSSSGSRSKLRQQPDLALQL
ncbi:Bromodomain-containing protein [Rhynchospora pubera]|uniref:Bromodomain-containing protein n=1 Tax=Rhynchospora pubera TaxID=906938 RepID=A0AAV8CTI4_9POAL|nr:Bromodomain-containing protein [Rhynchospora pubera]